MIRLDIQKISNHQIKNPIIKGNTVYSHYEYHFYLTCCPQLPTAALPPTFNMSENYTKKPTGTGGMAFETKTPANANVGLDRAKVFDKDGAIGNAFTEEGAIGSTAQKIGGPFDKEGVVGKTFTTEGTIGGSVQQALGGQTHRSN